MIDEQNIIKPTILFRNSKYFNVNILCAEQIIMLHCSFSSDSASRYNAMLFYFLLSEDIAIFWHAVWYSLVSYDVII